MAVSDGASSAGLSDVDGDAAGDGEAAGGGWAGAGDAAGGVDCCFSGAVSPQAPHKPIMIAASTAVRPRKFDARMVVIVKPVWEMERRFTNHTQIRPPRRKGQEKGQP